MWIFDVSALPLELCVDRQQLWQQQKQEKDELGATTTESDEPAVAGGATGEKGAAEMKRFKAPNKKFTWTDHLRFVLSMLKFNARVVSKFSTVYF